MLSIPQSAEEKKKVGKKKKREIALNMKADGMTFKQIEKYTGLAAEEIEAL